MRSAALIAAVVAIAWCLAARTGAGEAAAPPGLRVIDGLFLKDGKPFRGVGANYYDLYQRVWKDPKDTSSLEGLEKLAGAGIPFVRFACSGFTAKDWDRYFADKDEALGRLDLVVRAAERAGIGLVPSLFWTFVLHETVGERREAWGNPESRTTARMREYVRDIVGRYRESPAIWAWELGNEANLAVDLPNAAQFRPPGGDERDDLRSEHLVTMLVEFAKAARAIDPHRAIISGNSHPRATAWHNTRERSWTADAREQTGEIVLRDNPAPLDTIGIHIYGGGPVTQEVAAWATDRAEYLRWLKGTARDVRRPVFVGEFGVEATGDAEADRAGFAELLAAMEEARIDLAAFWVFDLSFQRTWNVTLENDRAWMLRMAAEASRRWAHAALEGK